MVFGFFRYMLSYRRKIAGLRKKYDRVREKADRELNAEKRMAALRVLDQVQPNLTMMEEQNISRSERRRQEYSIKSAIAQAQEILREKLSVREMREEKK